MFSPSTSVELSVIIPTLNEGDHLRRTIEGLERTLPGSAEILVVDDGTTDGGCDFIRGSTAVRLLEPERLGMRLGASGARNKGAGQANGAALVFLDAHVDVSPGWAEPLLVALRDPQVGAAAPGIAVIGRPDCCGFGLRLRDAELGVEWLPPPSSGPPEAPLLPGCCFAMRRDVFAAEGGFDAGLMRWGSEDAELSIRLWSAGYALRVIPDLRVDHLFRAQHPYAVDWTEVLHNMLRMALVHFSQDRLTRVIDRLKRHAGFAQAWAMLMDGDAPARRLAFMARRKRSDDDYFNHFGDIW